MSFQQIDLVVTYVDNRDTIWQKAISQYNTEIDSRRYRCWDIFKYWFRGIEQYMPWTKTIHLVVSNIEQVPVWLDQSKVHVVLHKDIIPEVLLPTFNSTTIEMYLHKIDNLSEYFIYSNDDMLAINTLSQENFFKDRLPVYELIHRDIAQNTFRMQCRNSYKLAAQLSGYKFDGINYFYIKHSMDPMLKSVCEEVHQKASDVIQKKCTKFREPFNFTQYLFPDYAIMTNRSVEGIYPFKYFKLYDYKRAVNAILSKSTSIICVNDSIHVQDFTKSKLQLQAALQQILPNKSKFEL